MNQTPEMGRHYPSDIEGLCQDPLRLSEAFLVTDNIRSTVIRNFYVITYQEISAVAVIPEKHACAACFDLRYPLLVEPVL